MPADVAAAFSAFPERIRARLLEARDLIFEIAAGIEGVGPLTETLKWGEPAYLTEATGSGSTHSTGLVSILGARVRSAVQLSHAHWLTISAAIFLACSPMRRTGPFFSTPASRWPGLRFRPVSEWRLPTIGDVAEGLVLAGDVTPVRPGDAATRRASPVGNITISPLFRSRGLKSIRKRTICLRLQTGD